MSVNIYDKGSHVVVEYQNTDGETSSAIVIGESVESIKGRQDEIISNHNLRTKAQQ